MRFTFTKQQGVRDTVRGRGPPKRERGGQLTQLPRGKYPKVLIEERCAGDAGQQIGFLTVGPLVAVRSVSCCASAGAPILY